MYSCKKFFTKLALLTLAITLIIPFSSNGIAKDKTENLFKEEFFFKVKDEKYHVETVENAYSIITTVYSRKGCQKFITNKFTGEISVTSDYLKSKEIEEEEKSVNTIAKNLDKQLRETRIVPENRGEIGTQRITGSWAWSSWQAITVTYAAKASASAIAAAILSRIPYIGWVAGATAAVLINYNLPVGYLRYKAATARDTHPDYAWVKKKVNVYRNKDRTILLDSNTSNPYKVRVY
jgi:hypothetical protein